MKRCAKSEVSQAWAAELRYARDITGIEANEAVSETRVRMRIVTEMSRHGGAIPASAQKQIARKGAASAHQEALMHVGGPLFIEGRSGTGKTTVVCGRLALKHRAATETGKCRNQLFVTRSSMLRNEVHRILETTAAVKGERLNAKGNWKGPVLATWDELLRHICSSCGVRFEKLPKMVSFECFCTSVLPQLRHVSALGPHLLWAEFLSRLSGPTTPSLLMYQQQSGEFSATGIRLLPEDIKHILAAFNEYKAYKKRHALVDDADLAAMLVKKMQGAGRTTALCFDELLVDEVQDFTPGQCSLLLALCGRPEGICFAGDTAQTITNGCGFTFDYLRDLVREKFSGVDPPPTVHLGVNYRSTQGIVALAKAQVKLLERFFPGTVDPIAEGEHHKPFSALPVFLSMEDDTTCTACVATLQGPGAQLDPAHFLVIVRSDPQRQALRQSGLNATILTVEEAKGLERDVVIVVDFFRNCPMPHAGLLWNFPRAALPMDDSKGYRTQGEESRIAWLLKTQTHPAGLRSLGNKERRDLYALAPATLEMKHLYVADTRAAGQLVHVERGTRLAQHMLQYYAQSGGLVEHLGPHDLGGRGIVSHPSVVAHVAAHGGPSLDHVLNVAQKSMELFQHAEDDMQKNAVFGEAARTFQESANELSRLPSDSDSALFAALTDMKHLAEGHWHMRCQKTPQEAAPCYLAARLPKLAGAAFAAAGDHLRAAACLLHIDFRAASSHLRKAGHLGRGMVVLLSGGGAEEALAEAEAGLREANGSDRFDQVLMAALQQSFLDQKGAAWLVAERGRENVVREWFLAVLQHGGLEAWSEELIEGIPSIASMPFAAAASSVVKMGEAARILRHCRGVSGALDPVSVVAGAFSVVAPHPLGPLLVLANALPAHGAYSGMRLEAAFGALEAICASELLAGAQDRTLQLKKCLAWCDNLPDLSDAGPPSARWTLARILLASTPGQQCFWDELRVESYEDIGTDVFFLRDEITKVLSPVARALSNSTSTLQALCEREEEERTGATYQWFRFVPLEVRGEGKPGVQLGGLALRRRGHSVCLSQAKVSVVGGDSPEGMGPSKALDGKAGTQWHDKKMGWLIVQFESPTTVDSYSITTASNSPESDPVSWRFEGSLDGENFDRLHHVMNIDSTKERYTEIGSYPLTDKCPLREVRELDGIPFTEWIARECVPVIELAVTSLCCLLPFAEVLNAQKDMLTDGVCKALQLIRCSPLMTYEECQAALVRALRKALSSGAASDGGDTPVFNVPLLNALAPRFNRCVVKESHLQELAARCLQWPTSSM